MVLVLWESLPLALILYISNVEGHIQIKVDRKFCVSFSHGLSCKSRINNCVCLWQKIQHRNSYNEPNVDNVTVKI